MNLEHVSIVIPSYNGLRVVRQCLETLHREAPECEIIVVDGGSTDGSLEVAREFEGILPRYRIVHVANHGWAHATNRGFELATGQYLVTINTDLFITRVALESMVSRLARDPAVGGVSPVLLNGDGSRQKFFGMLYWPNWVAVRKPMRVHLMYGCCAMMPRAVLERVGLFDENFFFYNEEFDWCWRAEHLGYHFELVPEAVVHLEGGSTPEHGNFQLEAQRGGMYLIDKHFPRWISRLTYAGAELATWIGSLLEPRVGYRPAWSKMNSILRRKALLESPFQLSGRGTPRLAPVTQKR
jgi:GT2 family glycosyltransferase